MINKDFTFKISISREGYANKTEATKCLTQSTAKTLKKEVIAFKEQEVTVDELIDKAITGHAFCYLYDIQPDKKYFKKVKLRNIGEITSAAYPVYKRGKNKGYFKIGFKNKDLFRGTQTIFVDIDFTSYECIFDYVDSLTYTPTALYCSYSDNVLKGGVMSRRFRLVYVFDEVLNLNQFETISNILYHQIIEDTNDKMDDKCWLNCNQYYNGGNSPEVFKSYEIYNVSDFIETEVEVEEDNTTTVTEPIEIEYVEEQEPKTTIQINPTFLKDLQTLDNYTFKKKWGYSYKFIFKTKYEEYEDGLYHLTDENYHSLYWNRNLIKDGQHRRHKLLVRGCTRRLIKEDITPEELLFNLYIDRERFIDNSDGVVSNEYLISTTCEIMSMTEAEIKEVVPEQVNRPKYVVNHTLNSTDRKKAVGKVRGILTDKMIGELLDLNASVNENLKVFEANGYSIKKSTLYNFIKKNGLEIEKPKTLTIEDIDTSKSIRENLLILLDKGIKTTYYQVQKIMKTN